MKFLVITRPKNGGSCSTECISFENIVHLVMIDRSPDNPFFSEAAEWVTDWFKNAPSSVDSDACHPNGEPIYTIVRVS